MTRIEQCQLGTVFVCCYGSARHIHGGCKRTYLSYRDMEAHVRHRHRKKPESTPVVSSQPTPQPTTSQPPVIAGGQYPVPPTIISGHLMHHQSHSITPNTSMPPPGLPVVNRHPIRPGMQQRPRQSGPVVIQPTTAASMPPNAVRHSIPGHVMHHIQPQNVAMRQHTQSGPSKSHGNLISIPIQGAPDDSGYNSWSNQQQQQWSVGSGRSNTHTQRQGKSYNP